MTITKKFKKMETIFNQSTKKKNKYKKQNKIKRFIYLFCVENYEKKRLQSRKKKNTISIRKYNLLNSEGN